MGTDVRSKSGPNYKWNVLIVAMVGAFMPFLDESIVNVSIPNIMSDFGSSVTEIEWIMTAYMLAFAALMPLTAWFRDRIGYKYIFLASLGVFTLGSLLCGLAWNLPSLITARIIQASGGGAITPTTMAMITEVFPREERGRALSFWGLAVILGPALGPTAGGYLTHTLGWRSIFLVNLPVGIACMFLTFLLLVKDRPHHAMKKPFDIWGFAFFTAFIVALLLGISRGEDEGWTSNYILACWLISILGLTGFMLAETYVEDRIIDLGLFRIPIFTSCMIMTMIRSIVLFGGTFLLPLFIQNEMGYDEITSGLIMLPSAFAMAAMMPLIGILSDKVPPRIPALIGLIFLTVSMLMYFDIDTGTSIPGIIIPTIIRSVGTVLLMAPVMTAMMNSVPQKKTGMATSMNNIILQVGGSIGIAAVGTLLTNRAYFHMNMIAETMNNPAQVFKTAVTEIIYRVHDHGLNFADSAAVVKSLAAGKLSQTAAVMSFQDTFFIVGIFIIIVLPFAFMLPVKKLSHKKPM